MASQKPVREKQYTKLKVSSRFTIPVQNVCRPRNCAALSSASRTRLYEKSREGSETRDHRKCWSLGTVKPGTKEKIEISTRLWCTPAVKIKAMAYPNKYS